MLPRTEISDLSEALRNACTEQAVAAAFMRRSPIEAGVTGFYSFSRAGVPSEVHVRGLSDRFVDDYERFGRSVDPLLPMVAKLHAPMHEGQLGPWEWWVTTPSYQNVGRPAGLAHYLLAPVIAGGDLAGVMHFARALGEKSFDASDLALASATALHVSSRLEVLRCSLSALETWTHSLSKRELDTAELLVKGLSNRQIGEALGISLDGAKKHVRSLFRKVNVGSRAELATALHQPPIAATRVPPSTRCSRGLPGNEAALIRHWR